MAFFVLCLLFAATTVKEMSAVSNLCLECKCHYDMDVIYCKSDTYIDNADDLKILKRFQLLVLENTADDAHVLDLKKHVPRIHERHTERNRATAELCKNIIYSFDMCVAKKEPPLELLQRFCGNDTNVDWYGFYS